MKLSCTQENLNRGLSVVSRIARPQAALPVLSNILLKTEKGRVKISATDLEIGITYYIGAKIEEEGAITVPARLLVDFVTMNTDKTIDLELTEKNLKLESEKYKAVIRGIDASEFPLIPEVKEEPIVSLSAIDFKDSVSQVLIATSLEELKPVLTGVCLKFNSKELKLAATDSFRLAEKIIPLETPAQEQTEVIVPSRTISELCRVISLINPTTISIAVSQNQILFALDDLKIVSRVIEGNFPEYESIIPKNIETEAVLEVGEFQNALKIAHLFAKEGGNNVKLSLKKDRVIVHAISPTLGENTASVPSSCSGPEIEITFNVRFLLDVLSVIKSDKISLALVGKFNPGMIRPYNRKDYLYLVMPLQTEE